MGDVFVDLTIFIGAGAKTLDRGNDHARVQLLNALPGETHPVEHAGAEVFDQHVARQDHPFEHFLALGVLCVERDRALVVIEHGEVQRIDIGNIHQLAARNVADARALDFDHIRAEPGEQLRTCRAGLHVREVKNADA